MADELYLISGSTLTDIGDAIRSAKGTTAKIQVGNYASEIRNNIPTYHTVTFKDLNSATCATYQVKNGESVVYTGPTPINTDETVDKYFNGWSTDTSVITADKTVQANTKTLYQVTNTLSYEQGDFVSGYCQITGCTNQEFAIIPQYLYNGTEVRRIIEGSGNVFGASLKIIVIAPYIEIGARAFNACTNLQDVYFLGSTNLWYNTIQNNFYGGSTGSEKQSGNMNFWLAPRIHTLDGCIVNTYTGT